MQWTVLASGKVGSVRRAGGDLSSGVVTSCLISCIKQWRFPQPHDGDVVVRYPSSSLSDEREHDLSSRVRQVAIRAPTILFRGRV